MIIQKEMRGSPCPVVIKTFKTAVKMSIKIIGLMPLKITLKEIRLIAINTSAARVINRKPAVLLTRKIATIKIIAERIFVLGSSLWRIE